MSKDQLIEHIKVLKKKKATLSEVNSNFSSKLLLMDLIPNTLTISFKKCTNIDLNSGLYQKTLIDY